MALIERVKNILLTPKTEWPTIAGETATPQSIYVGYVLILAAIGPIAMAIRGGMLLATVAVFSYVVALAVTFLLAFIVDALASSFGGEKDFTQSLKLSAYAYTAAWVAGIFQLLPFVGPLLGLIAGCYSLYTFYLGAPVLKKCTAEKAVGFTVVVVVCVIVLNVLLGVVLMSAFIGGGMAGLSGMGMIR
jgi:hypothetical protein